MTATAEEVEVSAVHAPGADVALRPALAPVEEYRPRFVMAPEEAKALDDRLRECMKAILREGVDYGTIPGMGDKPSLFKPGAEKLLQWFGLGFANDEVKTERDDPEHPSGIADKARRVGVTYRCTVFKELGDGRKVTVATCEAYAGYDEDRYYISEEDARAKAEKNERKWAAKDRREPNSGKWQYAAEYRAPWNSVVKMCQKRSLVGAAIDATAAAGLFTQDLEDMRGSQQPDEGTVATAAAFTAAADAWIMALAAPVRNAIDRWIKTKGWPAQDQWEPEKWCALLAASGFLTAQAAQQEQTKPAAAGPSANAFDAALAQIGDADWAEKIRGIADEEEARKVIAEVSGSTVLTAARRHHIRNAVLTRWPHVADDEERVA